MTSVDYINDPAIRALSGERFKLAHHRCNYIPETMSKKDGEIRFNELSQLLHDRHKRLYANDNHSVLMIFQAMDAAGKDSTIHRVFRGFYPQAVEVFSFKAPSAKELDHDFMWRTMSCLPERGRISVFNRSYYEEVLVTKVHPEYILNQRIPGIEQLEHINEQFWQMRYQSIRDHEAHLARNGTIVLKFFLHVSKVEQRKRFLSRIEDPSKNWKFSMQDLKEREYWDTYMQAFEQAIGNTSAQHAPWFVVPADHKWFMRLVVAEILLSALETLELKYPLVDSVTLQKMHEAAETLRKD